MVRLVSTVAFGVFFAAALSWGQATGPGFTASETPSTRVESGTSGVPRLYQFTSHRDSTAFDDYECTAHGRRVASLAGGACKDTAVGTSDLWPFPAEDPVTFDRAVCQGIGSFNGNGGWNDSGDTAAYDIFEQLNTCTDKFDTGGPPQTSGAPDNLCDSDAATAVTRKVADINIPTSADWRSGLPYTVDLGGVATTGDNTLWGVHYDATNSVNTGTAWRGWLTCEIHTR